MGRDGSAFVALGYWFHDTTVTPTRVTPLFLEQHMSSGTPYVRSIFADSAELVAEGWKYESVQTLIYQAASIVQKGFARPVPIYNNSSPEGRVILDLCSQDREACEKLFWLRNHEWACYDIMAPAFVVYEVHWWREDGICAWMTEKTGHKELRAIRDAHGLPAF
eukprot:NODE_4671_length_651_cov_304.431208.p1 GENE.NODE_4671_length_651_cov_304.431208~~NODE_4671_length_651_cov_304.431208.p1  ORF type:complete len:164 (+),score=36.67 NODE_4671_length_651_cov_304.431208:3-494(+)